MTPTSPFYKFKFEIVNGSVMAVGIHLNFMVMLFCGLVNLTFSAKGGIYSKNKPTSVKEATRRTNH
jgi:hypothetical protein